jgi:hypothetical protein
MHIYNGMRLITHSQKKIELLCLLHKSNKVDGHLNNVFYLDDKNRYTELLHTKVTDT